MRIKFYDNIEVDVSPNGRRSLVAVYREGKLLDRAAIDLSDPIQRERWAAHLDVRYQAAWLDILRDVDAALGEESEGAECRFVGDLLPFSPSPFPVHALPEGVREFVLAGAQALDCPPEFIACPLLALAAGVGGNRFELRITPTWRERPILWTAVVGDPGTAKSPALELALAPVLRLQEEAAEEWGAALEAYEAELARARKERAPAPERPELEHFTTTDATLEAIARILGHRRSITPGLCLVRDELVSWVRSYDAYHPRGERQVWMSLWSGAPVKVDRASKDTAFIPRPAVSVTGGIQPRLLPRLEEEAGLADGFVERFLYAYPATALMRLRRDSPRLPDLSPLLRELRRAQAGEIMLSEGAWKALEEWHDSHRRAQVEAVGLEERFLAKLPRHLCRLALVLHLLSRPSAPALYPLARGRMRGAIELADYFLAHARRVFLFLGEGATARRVIALLQASGGEMPQGALWRQLGEGQREGLPLARRLLERMGVLEVVTSPPGPRGGRPSVVWRLVPAGKRGNPPPTNLQSADWVEGEL